MTGETPVLSSDDSEYSPIEAMKAIARRLHHLLRGDLDVSMDVSYPYEMRFQHKGKLARVIMLGENLAIANGDSGNAHATSPGRQNYGVQHYGGSGKAARLSYRGLLTHSVLLTARNPVSAGGHRAGPAMKNKTTLAGTKPHDFLTKPHGLVPVRPLLSCSSPGHPK